MPLGRPSRWWRFKYRIICLLRRWGLLPPMFSRAVLPAFTKDTDSLKDYDIRSILCSPSLKDGLDGVVFYTTNKDGTTDRLTLTNNSTKDE